MFLPSLLLGMSFFHFWRPTAATATPNMMKQGEFGSLVLCPPGGKSFRMAWSLACEMRRKRRKRRSTMDTDESRTNIYRLTVDWMKFETRNKKR
uniref:Secreted protein n=1 Tax=Romanomermis culicivorax TaxID=13658 RepID=A0A915IXM0_ROMCU